MNLTIQMHDPARHLLEELQYPGITQDSVAITYAFIIAQEGDKADWPAINGAIRAKWHGKTALEHIKKKAWAQVEYWRDTPGVSR